MRIPAKTKDHAVDTICCAREYAVAVADGTPWRAATFQACVTPTPPGVTEVTFPSELLPATRINVSKLTGIPYALRNTAITPRPAHQLMNDGRNTRPKNAPGRPRIAPPSLALAHHATTCGQY